MASTEINVSDKIGAVATVDQLEEPTNDMATLAENFDSRELAQTWRSALWSNPKAVAWIVQPGIPDYPGFRVDVLPCPGKISLYMLFTVVSWGYDGLCSGVVIALPQFREDYGTYYEGEYVIPAKWQLAFTAASLIGLIIGGVPATVITKKWGRRPCLWFGYALTVAGVFLQWYSRGNLPMFFGSKLITGFPLGMFITIAPTYCSEVVPLAMRGIMTAGMNWCIVLGQVIGYGVMRQTSSLPGPNSYRILFALQWGFAAVAIAILPFMPESPYFYVMTNNPEKARRNAFRLRAADFDVDGWLASIAHSLSEGRRVQSEASFAMCFQGRNRIRTIAAVSGFFIQQNSGVTWVLGYMAYFMELNGMGVTTASNISFALTCVMLAGNMAGWVVLEMAGRRPLAVYGTGVLAVSLLMIGILAVIPSHNATWAQVAFMAVWSFVYQGTIGSVAWTILTEISTSTLRAHTQAMATIVQGVVGTTWSFVLPYLVNPDEANLSGKIAFIYGGILAVCAVVSFFIIPETKGRTFANVDLLFSSGMPLRKFAKADMDVLKTAEELKGGEKQV
ncbi:hypothetical protein SCUCBS95973_003006 [Sporothrix curviconia]|uniref:Major facilitator superfamily (MFS) profile domain-containing protein n=1 Tax=Sporothrix curviconia TaxID=1260050 RepID=A0ABP0BBS2_9PEZI